MRFAGQCDDVVAQSGKDGNGDAANAARGTGNNDGAIGG